MAICAVNGRMEIFMNDKLIHLKSLPFWGKLTPVEQEAVIRGTYFNTYRAGTMIDNSDEECMGMLKVVSGCIRVALLSNEGREITISRLHKGDVCMLTASCVFGRLSFDPHFSAEEDTVVMVINAPVCRNLNESNLSFECYGKQVTSDHLLEVIRIMQQLLFTPVDHRLASFLYAEYERSGAELHITHDMIAKNLGTAREVVTRTLNRFAEDGCIALRRGVITVLDPLSLRRIYE
ncbi:MAG: Crp/Fnr family transcriptional regulator [Oscillospiraceae bacterium]|nr:Crp/Fnr family transcriptional regulator [Oscillospiraceae bacterium]